MEHSSNLFLQSREWLINTNTDSFLVLGPKPVGTSINNMASAAGWGGGGGLFSGLLLNYSISSKAQFGEGDSVNPCQVIRPCTLRQPNLHC